MSIEHSETYDKRTAKTSLTGSVGLHTSQRDKYLAKASTFVTRSEMAVSVHG